MAFHPIPKHAAARRTIILGIATVLASLYFVDMTTAQTPTPAPVPANGQGVPFRDSYYGIFGTRDIAFRLNYDTERYGQQNGQFGIGVQGHRPTERGVLMFSAQYDLDFGDTERMGVNVGGGFRILHPDIFGKGETRILGAQLWYDGLKTDIGNYFNEIGFSLESLGDLWDFRVNGNFPVGTQTQAGDPTPRFFDDGAPMLGFEQYYLTQITDIPIDEAIGVVDFEVARRIGNYDVWVFGGGYGLDASGDTCFGGKVGARGWLGNDALLELAITQDDFFDTKVNFSVVWYPGRSPLFGPRTRSIDDRLRDPVIRNDYIATRRLHEDGGVQLHDENGDLIRIVHVDGDGTSTVLGDGSAEDPYNRLASVYGGSRVGDIVLVHSGSTYTNDYVNLRNNQRLLGEGGQNGSWLVVQHEVKTEEYGTVTLPETSPGAWTKSAPQINNGTSALTAVTLAQGDANVDTAASDYDPDKKVSYNEVSNLIISGGQMAIKSHGLVINGATGAITSTGTGIGEVDIFNMDISNTLNHGIALTPFVVTYDNNGTLTKEVLFSPTIATMKLNAAASDKTTGGLTQFSGIGTTAGDDIYLYAKTNQPSTVTVTEAISINNVASTGSNGWGINVYNNKSAASISDYNYAAGTGSLGGIKFEAAPGGATVDNATITGGAGTTGKGVYLLGATNDSYSPNFTFTDTAIANMGGTGLHVRGDATNVDFTGQIKQEVNPQTALLVEGDDDGAHTGTMVFEEQEQDAGVIVATAGNGLQFKNADGTYTFGDPTATTPYEGPIFISGAAGSGATAGIAIGKDGNGYGSDGTFIFSHANLTDINGTAFSLNGGTATVNYTGLITQTANAATAISISNHEAGTATGSGVVTFSEWRNDSGIVKATRGDGIQFSNASGTYDFNNKIAIYEEGGDSATAGINITGESHGTFTFSDAELIDINGVAFNLNGGTAGVNFTGKIVQDQYNFAAVNVSGGHRTGTSSQGSGTLIFNQIDANTGVVSATEGTGLQFNNANGIYTFNDKVSVSGAAGSGATAGISITGDSHGAFTFSDALLTDINGTAFNLYGGTADVNFSGLITQTANAQAAVTIGGEHTGTVNFNENGANTGVVLASMGTGLQFSNADGEYNFNDQINITGAAGSGATAGISITNGSDGDFTFSDALLTNINGTAFNLNSGSADVDFTGLITQNANDQAVLTIGGEHTGTVAFGEKVTDQGIIVATTGTGLLFNQADGLYTFSHRIDLDDVSTGIQITDSDSSNMIFSDVTIDDATDAAFRVNGGTVTVNFTGKITQDNAATLTTTSSAVDILGGHESGTINFNERTPFAGVVTASEGDGLQFNNADGTYNFNQLITVTGAFNSGASAGINIENDSEGTFAFDRVKMTDVNGTGFRLNGGTAKVDFVGNITQTANDALLVDIGGGHKTGAVTFTESTTGGGILRATYGDGLKFDDADSSYTFSDAIVLGRDGGSDDMDAGISITSVAGASQGVFTFSDVEITDIDGTAFNLNGGTATVNFTGRIEQDEYDDRAVATIGGGHTGVATFSKRATDAELIKATDGDGLQFDNADGTYLFNHKINLSGNVGDTTTPIAGIDIHNDSDGNFTFSNVEITSIEGAGFRLNGGTADVSFKGTITQTVNNAAAVSIGGGHAAGTTPGKGTGTVNFDEFTTGQGIVIASTGTGLQFDNADGTYNFNDKVAVSGTAGSGATAGVNITNGSDGTIDFAQIMLTNIDGTAFNLSGGTADVDFHGKITQTANNAASIVIDGNHAAGTLPGQGTGTVAFTEYTTGQGIVTSSQNTAVQLSNADGTYNFNDRIDVNGGVNGISIQNSDGRAVITDATIDGTTGHGVTIASAANVSMSNVDINGVGGDGINVAQGASSTLYIANCDINASGANLGINLNVNAGATTSRITLLNNEVSAQNAEAVKLDIANDPTAKTVYFLMQSNSLSNNSATAAVADLNADGNALLNATVLNNTLNGPNTATAFTATSNNANTTIRLKIGGSGTNEANTLTSTGTNIVLDGNTGTFTVEDVTNISTNNNSASETHAGCTNDPGGIPLP